MNKRFDEHNNLYYRDFLQSLEYKFLFILNLLKDLFLYTSFAFSFYPYYYICVQYSKPSNLFFLLQEPRRYLRIVGWRKWLRYGRRRKKQIVVQDFVFHNLDFNIYFKISDYYFLIFCTILLNIFILILIIKFTDKQLSNIYIFYLVFLWIQMFQSLMLEIPVSDDTKFYIYSLMILIIIIKFIPTIFQYLYSILKKIIYFFYYYYH
jgi:hypothetical protein